MHKTLLSILLILIVAISFGQVQCGGIAVPEDWDFDENFTPYDYLLQIDTITNPNNIWQIGIPQKTVVNSAYSSPNVIMTDTINSYPVNDTSVFIFKHIDQGGYSLPHSAELAGYYFVNSDSLNDYGIIEISLDQGTTWINIITDTIYNDYYYWFTPKPTLTGNSYGWQNFWVSLAELGSVFNVNWGDTIFYKFTFISDPIADNLDGLAFDSFQFCDGFEGIPEVLNNNLIQIYPNPVNEMLYIKRNVYSSYEKIEICNQIGQVMIIIDDLSADFIDIEYLNLGNGFYFLKYSNSTEFSFIKFIVCH